MTVTPNKGLVLPANNSDVDTWDVPVNANSTQIDTALGAPTTLNVVSASGTIVLDLTQYTPPSIVLAGALTADVNYQFPSGVGGFWFIVNGTTGNHAVTFSSGGGGSVILAPQGYSSAIVCDGTNVAFGVTVPIAPISPSFGATGYFEHPGGLIEQWGISANINAGTGLNIVFPIPFPNAAFNIQVTPNFSGSPNLASYAGIVDRTTFTLTNGTGTTGPFFWRALGN